MKPPLAECPHCGQTLPRDAAGGETDPVEQLQAWCDATGKWYSPDLRVHEDVAAEILGRAPGTLKNW
jgi:hypothetical protein